MATIVRYVNTDSTSGGDGTTNATSGANRAYPTLSAAESALRQDLTDGGGDVLEIYCSAPGGVADTTAVTFAHANWTTNTTNRVYIISSDDHGGKWDDTKYRLAVTHNGAALYLDGVWTTVRGLQVRNSQTSSDCFGIVVETTTSGPSGIRCNIERCIARGSNNASVAQAWGIVNYAGYGLAPQASVSNCVSYDWKASAANQGLGFSSYLDGGTSYFYNCTSYNNSTNFRRNDAGAGALVVKNCLSASHVTNDFLGTFHGDSNYNASSGTNAPGGNSRNSQTFTFVNAGAGDFHLASNDAGAKDYGTDLSADANLAFTVDIDGQTRSGTWDIGADEYIATVTGPTFYLLNSAASGSSHGALQLDGTPPADSTTGTGWTVGTVASGNYSELIFATKRASNTFGATPQPDGNPDTADCFRTDILTGTFAAGNWSFSIPVVAVDQGGSQDGRLRVKVWKSANANMSTATEISSGATNFTVATDLAVGTPQTLTATVNLPEITLNNEYLGFQFGWEITGAGS